MEKMDKVISGLTQCSSGGCEGCPYLNTMGCIANLASDALEAINTLNSRIGFEVRPDAIVMTATGTAAQAQRQGYHLGRMSMAEEIEKNLLYESLLSPKIKEVIHGAMMKEEWNR